MSYNVDAIQSQSALVWKRKGTFECRWPNSLKWTLAVPKLNPVSSLPQACNGHCMVEPDEQAKGAVLTKEWILPKGKQPSPILACIIS